jgi:hypothetical protein
MTKAFYDRDQGLRVMRLTVAGSGDHYEGTQTRANEGRREHCPQKAGSRNCRDLGSFSSVNPFLRGE